MDREPPPEYDHRCFVVVRAAKQFRMHARFDPGAPVVSSDTYRALIRQVVGRSPRQGSPDTDRIVVPGYADLRSFSLPQEELLKETLGGAWQSYVQRGHWRMLFPFPPSCRASTASRLAAEMEAGHVAAVHVVDFPRLRINHALLLFAVKSNPEGDRFAAYDPNSPDRPIVLTYDARLRRFEMQPTAYFIGGPVNVYEVYRSWWY